MTAGRLLVQKEGSRLIPKALSTQAAQKIATAIGTRIGSSFIQRSAGRWICVATAPVFAMLSKRTTEKVGEYADDLFRQDIEIEKIEGGFACTRPRTWPMIISIIFREPILFC